MMRVQPVYKCLYCGAHVRGEIMELSDRSAQALLGDIMEMSNPQFSHSCYVERADNFKSFGILEYVGFDQLN